MFSILGYMNPTLKTKRSWNMKSDSGGSLENNEEIALTGLGNRLNSSNGRALDIWFA